MNETINKIDILGETRNVAFNAMWPVGVTYTQYPGEKSPEELWPTSVFGCTWETVSYNGAFFRTEGGNAKTFSQCSINVTTSDNLNFTFTNGNPGGWATNDKVIFDGEVRTIRASITNGFRVNSAFTTSKTITNVTVLQNDLVKSHTHPASSEETTNNGQGHSHSYTKPSDVSYYNGPGYKALTDTTTDNTGKTKITISTTVKKNQDVSGVDNLENRPLNATYRIWRRTA